MDNQDNPLSFGELWLTVIGACYHPRGSIINKDVSHNHLHCDQSEFLFLFIPADDVLKRRWYFKEVRRFSSCHIKRSLSLGVAKNSSVGAPCPKKLIMELCRREEREGDSAQITSLSCYQTKKRGWYILSRGWRNKSAGYMQTPKVHTWPTQQVLGKVNPYFTPNISHGFLFVTACSPPVSNIQISSNTSQSTRLTTTPHIFA